MRIEEPYGHTKLFQKELEEIKEYLSKIPHQDKISVIKIYMK